MKTRLSDFGFTLGSVSPRCASQRSVMDFTEWGFVRFKKVGPKLGRIRSWNINGYQVAWTKCKTHTSPSDWQRIDPASLGAVSYTHLRAHETPEHLVCR